MLDIFKKIAAAQGVSGSENDTAGVIAELMSQYTDDISIDTLGTLIAVKKGVGENRQKIMLCAHMDEIGFMATYIEKNGFVRTADRRDYSLLPPVKLLPRAVKEAGLDSISVGKIYDIFASDGFTEAVRTHSNNEGMRVTGEYADKDFCGLCFLNLVDFDMAFGHRRDASGYAFALNEFDEWLANFIEKMSDDDVLVITADHGCDPAFMKSTDHTREYTPLIIYGNNVARKNLGTLKGFADIGATVADMLGVDFVGDGSVMEIFE